MSKRLDTPLTFDQHLVVRSESRSRQHHVWRRWLATPQGAVGAILVLLFAVVGIAGPVLVDRSAASQNLREALLPISAAHPLGTDPLGRDLLSLLILGARYTLVIGVGAATFGAVLGIPLGAVPAMHGGKIDSFAAGLVDTLLSFPAFLIAMSIVAFTGSGTLNVILALGVAGIPLFARLARGLVLQASGYEYVEAARAIGVREHRILWRHIFPNITGPLIVLFTLRMGTAILIGASLGFLGIGIPPLTPEWGTILSDARNYIIAAPRLVIAPGLCILFVVLGFNLLGDTLRDMLDPNLRR